MSELNQQEVNMEVVLSTEQSFDVIIVTEEEMELLFEKYIGDDGKSAYELAVEYGYEGTEEEFATYQAHAAEYAEEAKDARDTILNMSASATELPSGSAPTAQWDSETGIMLFGIPKGPKGDPGDDAPQIDDTTPSTEHPYSSAKVEGKLATINQANVNFLLSSPIVRNIEYESGTIKVNGDLLGDSSRIRTKNTASIPFIKRRLTVYSDGVYAFRVAVYTSKQRSASSFVAWLNDWTTSPVIVDEQYIDKVAHLLVRKVGHESDNISDDVLNIPDHLHFIDTGLNTEKVPQIETNIERIEKKIFSVPNNYTRCEYLKCTGKSSYIDTGVIPNNETGVLCETTRTTAGTSSFIGGCRTQNQDNRFYIPYVSRTVHSEITYAWNSQSASSGVIPDIDVGDEFSTSINYLNSRVITANEIEIGYITESLAPCTYPIWLLTVNLSGDLSNNYNGYLRRVRISQGEKIIRDLLPVYRNNDGQSGLYNLAYDSKDQQTGNEFYPILGAQGTYSENPILSGEQKNNPLYGKKVAIIGDSISTNGNTGTDANVPEITITEADVGVQLSAYLTYYDVQAGLSLGGHTFTSSEIGTEVTFTPVAGDVGKSIGLPNNYNQNTVKTWWEVAKDALGFDAIPVCWSGSSITSHEAGTQDYAICAHAWHPSQIRKCGIRTPGTMTRTAPDAIIIYRGTNDFSHTPYTKLTDGYFDGVNWQYPTNDEVTDGFGYKEGLCLTVKKLREAYPTAKIFICTLNVFKRINYAHFPTNNGLNTLPQYNNAIREVADYLGCGVIEFDKDGITFENCYSGGYITDSSTIPTHPTDKGHFVMGQKAITDIKARFSAMI